MAGKIGSRRPAGGGIRAAASTSVRLSRSAAAQRITIGLAWAAIVIGIVLRFSQLPTRALFFDEAVTQMRIAGFTATQMWDTLYDGKQRTALELRRYASADASASPQRTVASLADEDAQHPPLFYLAELGVVRLFGNALVVWRLLPALFGVLAIGAAYVLARQLFADTAAALLSAAVFALSPIERIYADQAREYSLLVLLALIATSLLVRALRSGAWFDWAAYAVTAALGLYASPFMAYALAAHGLTTVAIARRPRRYALVAFVVAAAAALIAYLPWAHEIATHRAQIEASNAWSADPWPLTKLAVKWIFNAGSTLFDLEYLDLRWGVGLVIVLAAAAFALLRGFQDADERARWTLGSLIVVPALILILPDLALHEHRSAVARYALPVFAALAIVIGRGLVGRPVLAAFVLGGGLLSCTVGALHSGWWDNDTNADDARVASIVNRTARAQVASMVPPGTVVVFAQLLDDDVRVSLTRGSPQPQVSDADPLFVLHPTDAELAALHRQTKLDFTAVKFAATRTAHDIGVGLGGAGAPTSSLDALYESRASGSR